MLIRTTLALAVSLSALNAQAADLSRVAAAFGNTQIRASKSHDTMAESVLS